MPKEFRKGVTMSGDSVMEEDAAQEIREIETSEEDTKKLILSNEEDFIQGLIDASEFAEEETQRVEIVRNGRLYFAFRIRPLSSEEYEKCKKKSTKYVRNKQFGMRLPEDTNRVKYLSSLIYEATVEEDRKKLWDNKRAWDTLNAKKDRIMNGLDVIECVLKAGEKDAIIEAIDKLSGYGPNIEEVVKN